MSKQHARKESVILCSAAQEADSLSSSDPGMALINTFF
jgi:hypothetical protein